MTISSVNFCDMYFKTFETMSSGNNTVTNPLFQRKETPEVKNPDDGNTYQTSYTDTAKKNTQEFAKEMAKENTLKTTVQDKNETYANKLNELLK